MKRLCSLVLCLCLLTGCAAAPQNPSAPQTQPPASVPLLDTAQAAGETGNLFYIPNPYVESMACPEIRLYGNSLLLYEHTVEGMLQLKRISLEDGSLLAQAAYSVTPAVKVQIGNGLIGLCDSGSGQVLLLRDSLETEKTYSVSSEGEVWHLNREMDTLYFFFPEEGLQAYDLTTGQTRWLLDYAARVQPIGAEGDFVLFSYTDRANQMTDHRCLNLSTATLETLPVEGSVHSGVRSAEQWLLRQADTYTLVNQEKASVFSHPEGMVQLMPGRRQLLITDGNYREWTVYDLEGKFLSRCALPEKEHASVGTDLVWSGYWQGYFFRDTYDNSAHLMFWDTGVAVNGEDLPMTSAGEVQPPAPVMEQALYRKAQALSQRFGLDIRIAEQCALDYTHYQADALTDPYLVRRALELLEQTFGNYPEGFFRQLPHGELRQIRIELVTNLRGQENMDTHPESVGGFAQAADDHYLIVFEGGSLGAETVYHEFSHVIDKRLAWDAVLRPHALFSEERWQALQPEGFRYAESYTDMPNATAAYESSGYFISRYSMTFPTEDRATLMAQSIPDKTVLQENPAMAEKMRYYAACIRDCFNTEGWPETTLWEYTPQ